MRESVGWTVQQYYDCLVVDPARNDMIVEDVLRALHEGRSPVVITERTAHADYLSTRLGEHCENVISFKGGQGVKQRRLLKERLESIAPDAPRVLVATARYLGEGFDDPRLDTLFLTLPVSWRGVLAQYAGRLHRLHDGKREVIIYDYADLRVAMLARMFQRRQRGYHAIGYDIRPQNLADDMLTQSLWEGASG
jgi:superfamily II DNA or RNA helicase